MGGVGLPPCGRYARFARAAAGGRGSKFCRGPLKENLPTTTPTSYLPTFLPSYPIPTFLPKIYPTQPTYLPTYLSVPKRKWKPIRKRKPTYLPTYVISG